MIDEIGGWRLREGTVYLSNTMSLFRRNKGCRFSAEAVNNMLFYVKFIYYPGIYSV